MAFAQTWRPKVGLNFLPMISGNPEIALETSNRTWYSLNFNFGIAFTSGAHLRTLKSCPDNFAIDKLNGGFVKIGGRIYPLGGLKPSGNKIDFFVGGALVGLNYNKSGSRSQYDPISGSILNEREFKTAKGYRWGWAGVMGMTFILSQKWHLEGDIGFQVGTPFKAIENFNCNGDYIPGYGNFIEPILVLKYGIGKAYLNK